MAALVFSARRETILGRGWMEYGEA